MAWRRFFASLPCSVIYSPLRDCSPGRRRLSRCAHLDRCSRDGMLPAVESTNRPMRRRCLAPFARSVHQHYELKPASQFVISLWGLDLPAVVKAASTSARRRKRPLPAPRALLLKPGAVAGGQDAHKGKGSRGGNGRGRESGPIEKCVDGEISTSVEDVRGVPRSREGLPEGVRCAIRGIDCIRPSFLSGRKRTNLGIIDDRGSCRGSPRCTRRRRTSAGDHWFGPEGVGASYHVGDLGDVMDGSESGDDDRELRGGRKQSSTPGRDHGGGDSTVGLGTSARAGRGGRSGAACRKKRRRCKEARRLRAAAAAAAAETASRRPVSTPTRHAALA